MLSMFKSFKREALGAKVPHLKHTTDMQTVVMPLPTRLVIPMQMHIGAPCTATVKKGDTVMVGTVIGKAGGFVSCDIHSGVSGVVDALSTKMFPNGATVNCVEIIPDGEQTVDPEIKAPVVTDHESFVNAVRASGLVGLGGAGFPTFIKLSPKDLSAVDTLVVNGAECEPYITADYREFMENPENVMAGIMAVKQYLDLKKVVIAIERNKPKAIDLMISLTKNVDGVEVKPLESKYPQGAEKITIEKCTGREVPQGGLPSDVGVLVMNVSSLGFIGNYLKTGMPLTKKRMTIDGDLIENPKNVEVFIGTPYSEIIDFVGGLTAPLGKLIMGGPMMGTATIDDSYPVIKQNNALLAYSVERATIEAPSNCIRCGRCVSACPMGLSPVEIAGAFSAKDSDMLTDLKVDLCMNCGCCTFVCPAKRPVTQTMALAKNYLVEVKKNVK